ncbi:MAG TPA: NAD(P)-binding domain-containing protein [Polyangiaceae bacterium]|nr:NAD(P)-binding domain-containing protein [Polyangiaceae bacterium]
MTQLESVSSSSFESSQLEEGAAFAAARARGAAAEPLDVLVIGAGQAGLSVGYHLKRRGLRFLIVDGSERVGDVWRKRWDSLRLFTPAWLDSLDGLPFPAPAHTFPTKDQMGDYLEAYAKHFELPIELRVWVQRLERIQGGYRVLTNRGEYRASQVVVAMSSYQRRRLPAWASELDPRIKQIHSSDYRHPNELHPGPVLVAGAGNSGAEIAIELAAHGHPVLLSGRSTGFVPFRISGFLGRWLLVRLLLRVLFHRVLTIRTPIGRKARAKMISKGGPLIRQRPEDLARAGVQRLSKVTGVEEGLPRLEDGSVHQVANVIWATGFESGLDFITLPIFDEHGEVRHDGGVVHEQPGLYFVGQHFLYSFSSTMIHGVGRDAARIAGAVANRATPGSTSPRFANLAASSEPDSLQRAS